THTLTITNADATPTSQLIVRASVSAGAFSIEPATLDLGPSASGTLTLHFAPPAPAHADAVLSLVASATNRAAISILAHGFGGAAPGSGPTLAVRTVFYSAPDQTLPGDGVYGLRPMAPASLPAAPFTRARSRAAVRETGTPVWSMP